MNTILQGDSLDILKTLEDESVDLLCTDPPYGYSFMGKSWDKALPDIGLFKECLRVLKPGAFAFVMSAPRSDVCSRMAILLEDAGFNIAFTPIYWTYASGFPKAMNIGKMVDKRNGRDQDAYRPFADYLKERRATLGLSVKTIDDKLGTNTAYSWWEGRSQGIQLPTKAYYLQLKDVLDLDNRYDDLIEREEAEREVLTSKQKLNAYSDQGYASGIGEYENVTVDITTAATPAAKALDGSYGGFQPKPAVEVVIVAMKPLSEKTYVDQALKNGKGITWLDDCRVPALRGSGLDDLICVCEHNHTQSNANSAEYLSNQDEEESQHSFVPASVGTNPSVKALGIQQPVISKTDTSCSASMSEENISTNSNTDGFGKENMAPFPTDMKSTTLTATDKTTDQTICNSCQRPRISSSTGQEQKYTTPDSGRFPANLLVSDDVLNDGRIQKSGIAVRHNSGGKNIHSDTTKPPMVDMGHNDSGSYSRFFSLDAWASTLPFLIVPKSNKREKNEGLENRETKTVSDGRAIAADNAFQRGKTARSNTHPTVKPLTLMSYLITLGSRPGDTVLDPFLGSGTTAIAAKKLGRQYIGIEREQEYVEIAEARIQAIQPTLI